jgi:hypothetical protein
VVVSLLLSPGSERDSLHGLVVRRDGAGSGQAAQSERNRSRETHFDSLSSRLQAVHNMACVRPMVTVCLRSIQSHLYIPRHPRHDDLGQCRGFEIIEGSSRKYLPGPTRLVKIIWVKSGVSGPCHPAPSRCRSRANRSCCSRGSSRDNLDLRLFRLWGLLQSIPRLREA